MRQEKSASKSSLQSSPQFEPDVARRAESQRPMLQLLTLTIGLVASIGVGTYAFAARHRSTSGDTSRLVSTTGVKDSANTKNDGQQSSVSVTVQGQPVSIYPGVNRYVLHKDGVTTSIDVHQQQSTTPGNSSSSLSLVTQTITEQKGDEE